MALDKKSTDANAPPPYSGATTYKLLECANDKYDLLYHSPTSAYHIHLTREPDTPHLTLRQGDGPTGPVLATADYTSFGAGTLSLGDPSDTKPTRTAWEEAALKGHVAFSAAGVPDLRWTRSYQKERHIMRPSRNYLRWTLTSGPGAAAAATTTASAVAPSTTLATLDLLPPLKGGQTAAAAALGNELGTLTWQAASVEQSVQDAAVLVVAAVVHRDRQVREREPMGPTIDVKMVERSHVYGSPFGHGGKGNSMAVTGFGGAAIGGSAGM